MAKWQPYIYQCQKITLNINRLNTSIKRQIVILDNKIRMKYIHDLQNMQFKYKTIDGLKVDGSKQNEYLEKPDFKSRSLARQKESIT